MRFTLTDGQRFTITDKMQQAGAVAVLPFLPEQSNPFRSARYNKKSKLSFARLVASHVYMAMRQEQLGAKLKVVP
jgi:hypothetical protein